MKATSDYWACPADKWKEILIKCGISTSYNVEVKLIDVKEPRLIDTERNAYQLMVIIEIDGETKQLYAELHDICIKLDWNTVDAKIIQDEYLEQMIKFWENDLIKNIRAIQFEKINRVKKNMPPKKLKGM